MTATDITPALDAASPAPETTPETAQAEAVAEPTPAALSYAANDAVLDPTGLGHIVASATARGRVTTACGVKLQRPELATSPDIGYCDTCLGKPALAPDEVHVPASLLPAEPSPVAEPEAPAPAPEPEAAAEDEPSAEDEPAPATSTSQFAMAPRLAAVLSGKVGYYELELAKKVYRLRDTRDGKLAPEAFEHKSDAAWFAQRRSRLSQYQGFGGRMKLFMPKVPSKVGPFEISGDVGKVEVTLEGKRVGPIWTHKTNSRVDALRWAERLARKPEYALLSA